MTLVVSVPDPGLGNTSYVVDLGDGSGLVVDPERDPLPYLRAAEERGLVIRHVAETHLHADFVSGARELVAEGASLIAPRDSTLAHSHRAVEEGDEVAVGDLVIKVLETPGHTPEHVGYVLYDGPRPLALFSGGTLMSGGVARPDLISIEETEPLAHLAYRSVHRLLTSLPAEVEIRPTHGAGSFCAPVGASSSGATTVGMERLTHPVMTSSDEQEFVDTLLGDLGSYPPYFFRLREINRVGPKVFGVDLPRLTTIKPAELGDRTVVDARPIHRFGQGHIPGSISIELRSQFGTWLGWLFPPGTPIVFVLDPEQDERELVRQTLNVGHEIVPDRIDLTEWTLHGGDLATIDLLDGDEIDPAAQLLDIRQTSEWNSGHVPDALHIELGDLRGKLAEVEPGVVVHCGHGQRAMTGASLLARSGNIPGGVTTASYRDIRSAITAK